MLLDLEIKNFILIKHHKIIFKNGFTALTGETGAGKSIILDALNLIKGFRFDIKYQKESDLKTEIQATFDIIKNKKVQEILIEKDLIDEENENILFIRRVILPNGKSSSYINNTKCSLQDLKKIGEYLIEIHSQNSNKNLLSDDKQQLILDIYCDNKILLTNLNKLFIKYNNINNEIKKCEELKEEYKNKVELIQYKINELEELNILEGEYEELTEQQNILSKSSEINNLCSESYKLIDENNYIYKVKENVSNLVENNNTKSIIKMIEEVIINMEEIKNSLNDEKENNKSDDFKLNNIESRINEINILSRKHFVEPDKIADYYISLKNELNDFQSYDENIYNLNIELEKVEKEWYKLALKISKIRKEKSVIFSESITNKIKTLKMKNASFKIVFENNNKSVNKTGLDKTSFQISTNLGSDFESLKKAASGGEISRIALAIQSIISKNYSIPTQIFDEIDVGIGGTTGNSIGLFLHEISNNSQVIGITHLPQVASFADSNYYIYKEEKNNSTITYIKDLNHKEKIEELSRMMGYENFTKDNEDMVNKLIENSIEMKKNIK